MEGRNDEARRAHMVTRSIEIAAPIGMVFSHWTRYEDFPRRLDGVRRVRRIDDERILWDADIAGRRVMWEARILESEPGKLIRWESAWGAPHVGEVRFEALPGNTTRMHVAIACWPQGFLERLGARLGLIDSQIDRDLERFRVFVERLATDAESGADQARS
jgi:uncharacterized membrane protein